MLNLKASCSMKLEFENKLPLALDYPLLDKEWDFFTPGTILTHSGTNSPKVETL